MKRWSDRQIARLNDVKILLMEGKTLKDIADLMGFKTSSAVGHYMKMHGLRSPNVDKRKTARKTLSYADAVERLKDNRVLDMKEENSPFKIRKGRSGNVYYSGRS